MHQLPTTAEGFPCVVFDLGPLLTAALRGTPDSFASLFARARAVKGNGGKKQQLSRSDRALATKAAELLVAAGDPTGAGRMRRGTYDDAFCDAVILANNNG